MKTSTLFGYSLVTALSLSIMTSYAADEGYGYGLQDKMSQTSESEQQTIDNRLYVSGGDYGYGYGPKANPSQQSAYREAVENAEFIQSLAESDRPFEANPFGATAAGAGLVTEPGTDCCTPF